MKKSDSKRKINYKKIIIVLAIILFCVLVFFWYKSLKVTNIYVVGNNLLKESEILSKTNLLDYPKLYQVKTKEIEEELLKFDLVNKVSVHKSLFGKVEIVIEENQVLYQKKDGKYVLSDNNEVDLSYNLLGIPTLVNDCGDVCNKLI